MNLEQIVKETVAKIVAEKQGKDLTGDGKIDSADYLQARSNAIEKAKGLDEDYEVAMAQDSLDSIIRAAMMLKTQMGDREVNLPAWIQDHITNSENYINQAAKGYHESDAQMDNNAGAEEMDEARFEKGEDVGGKGFEFKKIAAKAAKQYGSKEAGQRVAGAIMKKVLNKEGEGYDFIKSAIESASGDKITGVEEDDEGNTLYIGQDPYDQYFIVNGEIKHDNFQKGIKSVTIGMLKHYGDGQNHSADDDMYESEKLNKNTMTTNEGRSAEDLKQGQLDQAYSHLEKMKEKPRLFSKDDIKKTEDRIEKLEAELDALAAKATNESLDEATVRRWQHYAGIK